MEITRLSDTSIRFAAQKLELEIGPQLKGKPTVFLATEPQNGLHSNELRWFDGPGEYEVEGVMIDGIMSGENISYHIASGPLMAAALTLSEVTALTDDVLEGLQPASILLLSVSKGTDKEIAQLIGRFDAQVIVPVSLPCPLSDIAQALQLTPESTDRLKISEKELTEVAPQRLINLT